MSETKRIVLIANVNILGTLSEHLTQRGYEMLIELPMITTSVMNNIIKLKPDCVILSESCQFEDGFTLLKVIQAIKSQRRTRILIHTQTQNVGDRLLSDLISLNVYDFISLNVDVSDFIALSTFNFSEILALLETPREYCDIAKYHNYSNESHPQDVAEIVKERVEAPVQVMKEVIQEAHASINSNRLKNVIAVAGLPGIGKTFVATNLAITLANLGAKVAIIEANLENRHLFVSFKIEDFHNGFTKLHDQTEKESPEKYAALISKNLWVFAIPLTTTTTVPTPTLSTVLSAIDRMRTTRDIIIFDCSAVNNDVYLQSANTILLVSSQMVPKVIETESYISENAFWKADKATLVFNRGEKSIKTSDITEMFKITNECDVIPSTDKDAIKASINGQSAVERSKIAVDAFEELASKFWQTRAKKSSFRDLFTKK